MAGTQRSRRPREGKRPEAPGGEGVGTPQSEAAGAVFELPTPIAEGGLPLWQVLASRRSVRHYGSRPMTTAALSQLLWSTHGVTGRSGARELRNAPSAGACYPIDAYVVVNNVKGLDPGLYRFIPDDHALMLIRAGDVGAEVAKAALGQTMCKQASVTLLWTAVLPRTTGRYGERGHRYVFLDAGHVGQNTYLAATALGLGCCTIGAFDDEAMDRVVGADGTVETTVYGASVGPSIEDRQPPGRRIR
ncbi:MAG: SagB/ThcOx family dehydrogenase [Candidatus Eisenbacteria bacterium]|nr:SagB/ThcOx family dehydrogenase [Candidatus Eisenbacteria bacterium]